MSNQATAPEKEKKIAGSEEKTVHYTVFTSPRTPRYELFLNVYLVGPEKDQGFPRWLTLAGCTKANSIEEADLVIFTGGSEDIPPDLYGEDPNSAHSSVICTSAGPRLMMEYLEVFQECVYTGVPMVGVCLGAQFLHVMNGGTLYQHIENHYGDHGIWDEQTGHLIKSTPSVHHQMCAPNDGMDILATSAESTKVWRNDKGFFIPETEDLDIEAFWYDSTGCLGFQGHPEYSGYYEYDNWCLSKIRDYVQYNPDIEITDEDVIRFKQAFLETREFKFPDHVHKFIKENS